MREKQQKHGPRATAPLARATRRAGVLIAAGALAAIGLATASPTLAAPRLMVPGQPVGIAADPATHTFWVAELNAGQPNDIVDKIAETSHVITPLNVTSGVTAIAADPVKGLVWTIGNSADGTTHTVTYINESTSAVNTITLAAGSDLTGLAVNTATGTVFVLDLDGDVYTIDEAHPSNTPGHLITGSLGAATAIAVDPGTSTLWVVNGTGNSVLAFSDSSGDPIGSPVDVGNNPGLIAIDATTKTVWVGAADSTITEFAEATPGTTHILTLGSVASSLSAEPSSGLIWAGSQGGSIYEITEKTSPPSLIGSLTLPNEVDGVATDPGSGELWATENITSQDTFDNVIPFSPSAPKITSAASTWFANNNSSQDTFAVIASAFPPANYSITGAPSWLTIGSQTGILSAALTSKSKPGAAKITITANNGIGTAAHQSFTANVGSDPVLKTNTATFAYGVKNTLQLKSTGTPSAITYQEVGAPKGISLSKTGVLSGTPSKGTKSPAKFVVFTSNAVTEAFGQPAEFIFTLNLAPGKAAKITSPAKATFKHGKHASFTITSTGFPTPSLKESGKLPKGLTIKSGTGTATIAGTPAAADKGHTYKLTITATNGVGKPATQTLTLKIT
jgi:DNA-binding beta-propeller fold protein YncE